MGANPVELTDGTEAPGASDAPAPVAAAGGAIPLSNWLDALAEAMDELSDQAPAWGAIERGEASTTPTWSIRSARSSTSSPAE